MMSITQPIATQSGVTCMAVVAKRYRFARRAILRHAKPHQKIPYGKSRLNGGYEVYRRILSVIVLVGAISVTAVPSVAFDFSGGSRFAVAEFAEKVSRCIAFYGVLGQGKDHRGNDAPVFQKMQGLSERLALDLLQEVKKFGIKSETILSYIGRYTKEMGKDMNYDAINSSIIMDKHGPYCKYFGENWRKEWDLVKNSPKYN
jgi:hypothetical protein